MTLPFSYVAEGLISLPWMWANLSDSLEIRRIRCRSRCVTSKARSEAGTEFLLWSSRTLPLSMLSHHEPRTQLPCCEEAQAVTLVRTHWSIGSMSLLIAPAELPADSKYMKTPLGAFGFRHLSQAQPFEAFHLRLDITKLSVFLDPRNHEHNKMVVVLYHWVCPTARSSWTQASHSVSFFFFFNFYLFIFSHSVSSSRTETSFLLAFLFTGLWDHLFSVLLTKNLGLPLSRFIHVDPFIFNFIFGSTGSLLLHGSFL